MTFETSSPLGCDCAKSSQFSRLRRFVAGKGTSRPVAWFGLAVLLSLFMGSMTGCKRHAHLGQKAPDFSVVDSFGRQRTLASYHGRVLVLNFWASWCPPCVEETPALNTLHQELAGRPISILAISVDQDGQAYRKFLKSYQVQFPTARDPQALIAQRYGTVKYPESYIIDAQGHMMRKVVGAYDWSRPQMLRFLKDLTQGD